MVEQSTSAGIISYDELVDAYRSKLTDPQYRRKEIHDRTYPYFNRIVIPCPGVGYEAFYRREVVKADKHTRWCALKSRVFKALTTVGAIVGPAAAYGAADSVLVAAAAVPGGAAAGFVLAVPVVGLLSDFKKPAPFPSQDFVYLEHPYEASVITAAYGAIDDLLKADVSQSAIDAGLQNAQRLDDVVNIVLSLDNQGLINTPQAAAAIAEVIDIAAQAAALVQYREMTRDLVQRIDSRQAAASLQAAAAELQQEATDAHRVLSSFPELI